MEHVDASCRECSEWSTATGWLSHPPTPGSDWIEVPLPRTVGGNTTAGFLAAAAHSSEWGGCKNVLHWTPQLLKLVLHPESHLKGMISRHAASHS